MVLGGHEEKGIEICTGMFDILEIKEFLTGTDGLSAALANSNSYLGGYIS